MRAPIRWQRSPAAPALRQSRLCRRRPFRLAPPFRPRRRSARLLAAKRDLPLLHDVEAPGLLEALQQVGAYDNGLHRIAQLLREPGARILARDIGTNREEL